MSDRIIELALETLELRKAAVQAEIDQLRAQLKSSKAGSVSPAAAPAPKKAARGSRGPRSAASRKAQSARMKEFWARKRADAAGRNSAKAQPAASKKNSKD
jgi:uncharacterized small protein (DUF1192 family)